MRAASLSRPGVPKSRAELTIRPPRGLQAGSRWKVSSRMSLFLSPRPLRFAGGLRAVNMAISGSRGQYCRDRPLWRDRRGLISEPAGPVILDFLEPDQAVLDAPSQEREVRPAGPPGGREFGPGAVDILLDCVPAYRRTVRLLQAPGNRGVAHALKYIPEDLRLTVRQSDFFHCCFLTFP